MLYDSLVLIDTWWNVNLTSTGYVRRDVRVLIDTWWNVNFTHADCLFICVVCFNRYMVECESVKSHLRMLYHVVLIDTWWNVNSYPLGTLRSAFFRFNRYMVECELYHL